MRFGSFACVKCICVFALNLQREAASKFELNFITQCGCLYFLSTVLNDSNSKLCDWKHLHVVVASTKCSAFVAINAVKQTLTCLEMRYTKYEGMRVFSLFCQFRGVNQQKKFAAQRNLPGIPHFQIRSRLGGFDRYTFYNFHQNRGHSPAVAW